MSTEPLTAETLLERIRGEGVRRTAVALRKPPLPSRLLQELAVRLDAPEAMQFVAAYPLSPSHLLESLARDSSDPAVLALLATNPRTPPHLLLEFAAHEDPVVRAQAAAHPQLASRELLVLARDPADRVRRSLAANPSLRLPHQATLVFDREPAVRVRLAAQPGLPAPVALVLGSDASTVVRAHTVATAKVEDDLLLGWAAGDEEDVQLALGQRKDLSKAVQRVLLHSPHPAVRRAAREAARPDDVDLLHLATDGDPEERRWVAAREPLARPLQSVLAQDPDAGVRATLAANPLLEADIARFFLGQAEEAVCAALAVNPAVPSDLVQELAATRENAVLSALAYRKDIDDDLVQFLLGHSSVFRRHWAVQQRPLERLTPDVAKTLFADPLPTVRVLAVAGHPGWRRADLYEISRDPSPLVRIAAIRHPNAPDELLADRLGDPAPEVAEAAHGQREARARAALAAPRVIAPPVVVSRPAATAGARPAGLSPSPREPAPTPAASVPVFPQPPVAPVPTSGLFNKLKRLFWQ